MTWDDKTPHAVLPQDIEAALVAAIAPALPETHAAKGLRARILQRSRAEAAPLLTIRADEDTWQPFLPKIRIKVLYEEGGYLSYLLRLEPGAEIAPHAHPLDEECVVLEGEVRMGDLVVRAGDYHLAPRGTPHGLLRTDTGALLFLRGAVPEAAHFL